MTGADFAEWRVALGLSLTEAAKLLGVGRPTIMGYLKKDELPPVVTIACRALARDRYLPGRYAAVAASAQARNRPVTARLGSSARMISPMTAMPLAPAARQGAAVCAVMPPSART
jgi:transcriptional regulator with XRE-family HTH domain